MYRQLAAKDKILILYKNTPATLLGNLFGCLPLGIVMAIEGYTLSALIWVGGIYLLTLMRWLHFRHTHPSKVSDAELFHFGREQTWLAFASGCLWGSAGILFFDVSALQNLAFLILTFVCMMAGSLASLSARPMTYSAFAIPIMLPLILNLFLQDEAFYKWMSLGATAYLLATFSFSLNLSRVIENSLALKYENIDLIANLKEQTDKANRANRDKSRFLAATSHDLRQPLHAANLFYELLSNKVEQPEQLEDLHNLGRSLNSLNSLLSVMFDISKLDAGIIEPNKVNFDLSKLLEKLASQFALEADGKGLTFSVQAKPQHIFSDPALLELVLTNLLVNALKYTHKGGVCVFTQIHGERLDLHIKDTGIGIPSEHLEDIFTEFFQIDNPERDKQKGLGLGLSIVKRIMDLLGHPLRLTSTAGQGSEFVLSFPLGDPRAECLPKSLSTASMALDGQHILLVDNELDIVLAMQKLLSQWGCSVTTATSTEQVLSQIQHQARPDLIICDFRMPGALNGCEIIQQLRTSLGDIPALILTGDTDKSVAMLLDKAGLPALHKPVKPAQLRIMMARLLKPQNKLTSRAPEYSRS